MTMFLDPMTTLQFLTCLISVTFDALRGSDHHTQSSDVYTVALYYFSGLPDCSFLNFCHFFPSLSLPHTYWCVQEFCPQPTCLKILSLV